MAFESILLIIRTLGRKLANYRERHINCAREPKIQQLSNGRQMKINTQVLDSVSFQKLQA